jgi:hypothetical protein
LASTRGADARPEKFWPITLDLTLRQHLEPDGVPIEPQALVEVLDDDDRVRIAPGIGRRYQRTHLGGHNRRIASYTVNDRAVARARRLIESRQYVLDSDWGEVQPRAADQNAFLENHSWEEYAEWHLGLTEGAPDETKARYAFVYGDFRRIHRTGVIACHYRAAEWRHKEIELAAHDLLQLLDAKSG